jgi:hypothetical protein
MDFLYCAEVDSDDVDGRHRKIKLRPFLLILFQVSIMSFEKYTKKIFSYDENTCQHIK